MYYFQWQCSIGPKGRVTIRSTGLKLWLTLAPGQQTILIVEPCFLTLLVRTPAELITYAVEMLSPWVSLKSPPVYLETWGICQTCSGLKGSIHPSHDAVPTPNSPSKGLLRNMCVLSFVTYSCGHMCFPSASPGIEVSSVWYVIYIFLYC